VDGLVSSPPTLPSATVPQELSCLEAYQREFDYLYRTLRRLGVRTEDLEDQAQEIFLVLDRRWHEFDSSRPLRPYLFGIAFRVVAANRRKQQREEPRALEEVADDRAHPDEALDAARSRALVLTALARIPLPRRGVFVMHDLDEVPMREIAQALSLPLFTGYSRLRTARREFEAAIRALREGAREP
jgi:RNA polymerase sigma-70 factor (ECF subfamily)